MSTVRVTNIRKFTVALSASLKTSQSYVMSSLENQSMDKYTVVWKKPKKVNGFYSTQKVTVYGISAVQSVIEHVVPDNTNWDDIVEIVDEMR